MKPKVHFFQPNSKASTWSTIRQKAIDGFKQQDLWWGLLFVVVMMSLFVTRSQPSVPMYKIGEIAERTVRAGQDISVPDVSLSEKKKLEAQSKVLPVYDFDPTLADSSVSRLHEIFTFARSQNITEPVAKKTIEKLSNDIQAQLNVYVDPAFLTVAAKDGFSNQLETSLSQVLRKMMSQPVISDRRVLFLYAAKGLSVRNRSTGHEDVLSVNRVPDIRDLQQSIRTDLMSSTGLTASAALSYSEFVNSFLAPTIYMNTTETQSRIASSARNTEPVFYQVKKGKVIVRDGEEVTPSVEAQLNALRAASQTGPPIRYSVGILLLLAIIFISLKKYLDVHQYSDIKLRDKSLFQLVGVVLLGNTALAKLGLVIAFSLSTAFASSSYHNLMAYQIAIPFAAGALLLTVLTDREISVIYSFGFAILAGVLTRGDFYVAIYCLSSGIAAAFTIKRYYQRSAMLKSCLWIWLANVTTVFTIYLLREIPLNWSDMAFHAGMAFISALLSAAVASVLSPFLEWAFNITTDIKLLELSNLDLPVLRQLALEAPGTYHHSIVMGTIAEAAAVKVGANPLFLRVAALYHDIGKVRKSEYYVENQRESNKHDTLNPRMSALVIINHVKEGIEVARMLRLPSDLAAMIPQHHGTRLITYFYKKAKDMENPEIETVREEDYRYPGPKPQSKEGAILMLADATEAASRTLTDPSPARLRNMVDTLFRAIFEDGQLDESNLTMKDLNLIAEAFVRKLESVFHHRISYPGYEFNKDDRAKDTGEHKDVSEKMAN
jgi:cyclic-di-AMP phosphodiesterase PgpH